MLGVLFLLIVLVPVVELWAIIQVWQSIGGLETIALLVLVALAGAWLVKREGLGVWARLNAQLAEGNLPAAELVDGVLIMLAGALFLFPGFISDVFGIVLLLPPVRAGIRAFTRRRFAKRLDRYGVVRLVTWGSRTVGGSPRQRTSMYRTDTRRTEVADVTDVRVVDPPELEP